MVIVLPYHRIDVPYRLTALCHHQVRCNLADYSLHFISLQLRGQTICDFINSLPDGIHLNDETSLLLLEASLSALGVAIPFEARTATITGHSVFPGQCLRCGDFKHTQANCPVILKDPCDLCGPKSHVSEICIVNAKLCFTCGQRGHLKSFHTNPAKKNKHS